MRLGLQATNIFFEGSKHAGVSRSSLQLLEAILRRTEHEYVVFVRPDAPIAEHWLAMPHVKVVRASKRNRTWHLIGRDLEPLRHNLKAWFSVSGYVPRTPGVVTATLIHDIFFHSFADTYTEEDRVIHQKMYANSARHASVVFSNSHHTAEQFSNHFRYPLDRVVPLPFGVGQPPRIGENLSPLSAEDREGLGLPAGKFILSVSTLEPRKNFPRLLRAFSAVANSPALAGINLAVAGGKGWKTTEIFDEITRSGLSERVVFLGYVEDESLVKLYRSAEFAVTASLEEGFGIPVLEAMTYGCPICSSNTGALQEVGGDLPVYFNPTDEADIAEALIKAASRQNRPELIARGLERSTEFGWDKSAEIVLRTFQNR
ncbi:MAG: glycosyltransferase family 1 protein [Armatimonadota bacterium]